METKKTKNYTNEEATAKIKVLIQSFYEDVGREEFGDIEMERSNLIEEIDEILSKTNISSKHLVIERFRLDENTNEDI